MNNSLVSVILAFYNGERYLSEAIESILAQTYRLFEIIVVDDGSTDRSADIARSYKYIHYIYQSNQGVAAARNAGIGVARGEFLAFLDADDLWPPDKLDVHLRYMNEHSEILCTIGKIKNFIEPGTNLSPQVRKSILEKDQIGLMTLVVRKIVFERSGVFNPDYKIGSDFEWFTRIKAVGIPMTILPDIVLHRRIHNSNISSDPFERSAGLLKIFKASIDRHRPKQ